MQIELQQIELNGNIVRVSIKAIPLRRPLRQLTCRSSLIINFLTASIEFVGGYLMEAMGMKPAWNKYKVMLTLKREYVISLWRDYRKYIKINKYKC